jgi:carboxymethylenebutenolidase
MSAEAHLTSDVIGLTKTAPFSRRGFMSASAARRSRSMAC